MNSMLQLKGSAQMGSNNHDVVQLLRQMHRIRAFEEKLSEVCKQGEVPGSVHLYIGEEAVAVGVCSSLKQADKITSTHRGHGHFLAKGGSMNAMMAEILGKAKGICGGKGGSMHVADVSLGILGANGIVAGGIAIAVGAALAAQLDAHDALSVAFFGDGAANEGVLSEALNLSALWLLPIVFVCENNGFSEFSRTSEVTAGVIADRARPYGIPSTVVDGNDVLKVQAAAQEAITRARSGRGPSFIEAKTYRYNGHVETEKTFLSYEYRTAEEVEVWRRQDPIIKLTAQLIQEGIVTVNDATSIHEAARGEAESSYTFAVDADAPAEISALVGMLA